FGFAENKARTVRSGLLYSYAGFLIENVAGLDLAARRVAEGAVVTPDAVAEHAFREAAICAIAHALAAVEIAEPAFLRATAPVAVTVIVAIIRIVPIWTIGAVRTARTIWPVPAILNDEGAALLFTRCGIAKDTVGAADLRAVDEARC